MKAIAIQDAKLEEFVRQARRQAVVFTRRGKPVAVLVGITGMDLEQVELSLDGEFWKMIEKRRRQPTISRAELEKRVDASDKLRRNGKAGKRVRGTA
jgi:prevent-host-death family protein